MESTAEALLDAIYDAAAGPERWLALLDGVAATLGAVGGVLIRSAGGDQRTISSPRAEEAARRLAAEGRQNDDRRIDRLIERLAARSPHVDFLTDRDFHAPDEVRAPPMHTRFPMPGGGPSCAGAIIQGVPSDGMVLVIDGFPDAGAAWRALPLLHPMRPHFVRVAAIGAQMHHRQARSTVAAMQAIGMAAALLDRRGRLQALNEEFETALGTSFADGPGRIRLLSPRADAMLERAILAGNDAGASLPLLLQTEGPRALRLVPLRGDARDIFDDTAFLLLATGHRSRSAPGADLLQTLFDLTPAEARVARGIGEGLAPAAIAGETGAAIATVRTHLAHIYEKTGTVRQGELAALVGRFGF